MIIEAMGIHTLTTDSLSVLANTLFLMACAWVAFLAFIHLKAYTLGNDAHKNPVLRAFKGKRQLSAAIFSLCLLWSLLGLEYLVHRYWKETLNSEYVSLAVIARVYDLQASDSTWLTPFDTQQLQHIVPITPAELSAFQNNINRRYGITLDEPSWGEVTAASIRLLVDLDDRAEEYIPDGLLRLAAR